MNGIDCATKLTPANVQALKSAGIKAVGRYLGRNLWNGLTVTEAKAILDAGLALFLILELSPTKSSYFNYLRGISDAQFALAEAEYLGAPKGIAIYFTVDYEAQPEDMPAIKEYLRGVHTVLTGKYLVGIYGSYAVMVAAKSADYPPDRYFQTYAWSYGKQAPNHIYQYSNNVTVAGVACDKDYVNDDAGLWIVETTANTAVEKGSENMNLEVAVLMDTEEDFWSAIDVSRSNGNCALFVRPSHNATPPADAMKAKHLITVGGATTGHPNETLLSGDDKFGTAAAVKKYLG
ncbi:hypothetical protein DEAC_c02470 [Desulfosporosinus acididurans]|uniref:Rv2525c-like glycoside hydrolase-like domain-containing protein n=1 Tax=Desulfosporosinus acididurans TaxID=476652 RepID=A0A0J1FWR5_9FIRM|nr:DUF1906 domain-containing protein [Desulfosporosinus acididurans]KLU67840.1 hypothetical protein DEAC_c02470 [Desulfosporosinus acididurans]